MNLNGSDGSNLLAAFPAKTFPPATMSFFTGAPSEKSMSDSGTQKALGLVAESKNSTLFFWSQTVRQSVDEMFGLLGWVMPTGTPIGRITLSKSEERRVGK